MRFLRNIVLIAAALLGGLPAFAAGNNGVIVGAPTFVTGKFGQALSNFNTSNYVAVPVAVGQSITPSTGFGLAAFVRITNVNGVQVAWAVGSYGSGAAFIGMDAAGHAVAYAAGFQGPINSNVTISDGAWHYVVANFGTAAATICADGESPTGTLSGAAQTPDNNTGTVGGLPGPGSSAPDNTWNGDVDEPVIRNGSIACTVPTTAMTGAEPNTLWASHLDGNATDISSSGGGTTPATAPTFSPPAGTYTSAQSVTVSSPTGPVRCTTDGSTPTGSSPVCTTVSVPSSLTIKAYTPAPSGSYTDSSVSQAAYAINTSSVVTIDANDATVYCPRGGWVRATGSIRTTNPGNYCRVGFTGTSFSVKYNGSASVTGVYPRIRVVIDGASTGLQAITSSPTGVLSIATGLAAGKHVAEVSFAAADIAQSRWTTPTAILDITGFVLDSGATSYTVPHRTKLIWMYTDSIGEGYNGLGNTGNQATSMDATTSSAATIRRAFDAETAIFGFSGAGLAVTVGSPANIPALPSTYNYNWAGQAKDTSVAPDLITYFLGQNDSNATAAAANLVTVVNAQRALFPNAVQRAYAALSGQIATAILNTQATVNQPWYKTIDTTGFWPTVGTTADSADGVHPLGYAAEYIIAPNLFPSVSAALYPTTGTIRNGLTY